MNPSDMSCEERVRHLYDAIFHLASGNATYQVQYGDREVTYHRGQLSQLKKLYAAEHRICGQNTGLPANLDTPAQMRRGPLHTCIKY